MRVYASKCMYMRACACICVEMTAHIQLKRKGGKLRTPLVLQLNFACICVYMRVYPYIYIYIFACMCVYMCVYACICVLESFLGMLWGLLKLFWACCGTVLDLNKDCKICKHVPGITCHSLAGDKMFINSQSSLVSFPFVNINLNICSRPDDSNRCRMPLQWLQIGLVYVRIVFDVKTMSA